MRKWLLPVTAIVTLALLTGCETTTGTSGLGEGRGALTRGDFDPFGGDRAPVDLHYFTAPRDGRYRVTLTSGSGDNPLRNPVIWVLRGRVRDNRNDFLRAYRDGRGVVAEATGQSIATLGFGGTGGDTFTLVFTSRRNDLGTYDYLIERGGGQN